MIEITWGEFHFICQDKTVAILLAAAPLVLMLQLPPVFRAIRKLFRYKPSSTELLIERVREEEKDE